MGRLEYLTRLALGRSAFGEVEDFPRPRDELIESEDILISAEGDAPDQAYDAKGRPTNPDMEVHEAAQRHAQNSVLELFGVVYKKQNEKDLLAETKSGLDRAARQKLLKLEDDCGDGLQVLVNISRSLLTWWPDCIIAMVQAGVYPATMTFTAILAERMEAARAGGLWTFLTTALAGFPAGVLHTLVRTILRSLLDEILSRLQGMVIRQPWPSKRTRSVNEAMSAVHQMLILFTDAALFPLEYYIAAQQIGLAPPWPLTPAWHLFNPSDPSSIFQLASPFQRPLLLHFLCVPARMMLLQHLENDRGHGEVVMPMLTDFQYENINQSLSRLPLPQLHRDPWGWLWSQGYLTRSKILMWCGWKIEQIKEDPTGDDQFQNNTITHESLPNTLDHENLREDSDGSKQVTRVYRSTALSHLPAESLAYPIDNFFTRLVTLPFDWLLYRTLALSYLDSSFPHANQTLQRSLWNTGHQGWSELGSYCSKIGLGLALRTSIDLGLFLSTYIIARNRGMVYFEWGYGENIGYKTVPPVVEGNEEEDQVEGSTT